MLDAHDANVLAAAVADARVDRKTVEIVDLTLTIREAMWRALLDDYGARDSGEPYVASLDRGAIKLTLLHAEAAKAKGPRKRKGTRGRGRSSGRAGG